MFDTANGMRLIDDLNMDVSLSEDSLVSDFDSVDMLNKKGKRTANDKEIDEGTTDLFNFSKSLNK